MILCYAGYALLSISLLSAASTLISLPLSCQASEGPVLGLGAWQTMQIDLFLVLNFKPETH